MSLKRVLLLLFLMGTIISVCGFRTALGQEMAQSGHRHGHKWRVEGKYPHGWKPLHPVHKRIKLRRRGPAELASGSHLQSSFQPAGSQPISQAFPLWQYSIVAAQDGNTYQGTMVGRSPYYNGHRSTTVQAYLVPVILTFPDGSVFDPTAADNCIVNPPSDNVMDLVQNSPEFQTTDFTLTDSNGNNPVDVGTTEYGDAFQRANFWTYVSPSNLNTSLPYHTLLSVSTLPAINVTVPSGYGFTESGGCGPYGVMDYNWWDNNVTYNLIQSLSSEGVGPSSVPIFIFDSVVMYLNADVTQCCALADHGAYMNPSNQLQTYIVADFDTSGGFPNPDIQPLSHEIGEWIDDPTVSNPTPSWGPPSIENSGPCQSILEVGDGLDDPPYVFAVDMPNGVQYSPQELVFFSWFYNQVPSIGAGGWYSDQGALTSDAGAVCQ